MRTTITLTGANEDFIKSIKGYGESYSSAINKAIEYTSLLEDLNQKYDVLIKKIDEEFDEQNKNKYENKVKELEKENAELKGKYKNFVKKFLSAFNEDGRIDFNKMQELKLYLYDNK